MQGNPTYVTIGSYTWMVKNLDVDHYRNGDLIPQETDPEKWSIGGTGAWCYYNNDSANGVIYGKLYNFWAIRDPRGLAPKGWHISSDSEWINLSDYLGANGLGGKLKEAGLNHWLSPNEGATNSSGFSALPGGCRGDDGRFIVLGTNGAWWTSTIGNHPFLVWAWSLSYNSSEILRSEIKYSAGYSVRCVKDR